MRSWTGDAWRFNQLQSPRVFLSCLVHGRPLEVGKMHNFSQRRRRHFAPGTNFDGSWPAYHKRSSVEDEGLIADIVWGIGKMSPVLVQVAKPEGHEEQVKLTQRLDPVEEASERTP